MRLKLKLNLRYKSRAQLLALATILILCLAGFSNLAYGESRDAALITQAPALPNLLPRQYYLTFSTYSGATAKSACDPGYHMASLWEILDTTRLRYNTSLGYTQADSGQGPPASSGWVRTGYSSDSSGSPGSSNCYAWTSNSASYVGSSALLESDWISAGGGDVHVWSSRTTICSLVKRVWCVADRAGFPLYLPLVMK
jgi:hypothetical protein